MKQSSSVHSGWPLPGLPHSSRSRAYRCRRLAYPIGNREQSPFQEHSPSSRLLALSLSRMLAPAEHLSPGCTGPGNPRATDDCWCCVLAAGRHSVFVQELEAQNKRLVESQTEVSGRPADFLPRADHARIVTSRVEQANLQVRRSGKLSVVERAHGCHTSCCSLRTGTTPESQPVTAVASAPRPPFQHKLRPLALAPAWHSFGTATDSADVQAASELRTKLDQAQRDFKWRLEAQAAEHESTAAAGLHQVRCLSDLP